MNITEIDYASGHRCARDQPAPALPSFDGAVACYAKFMEGKRLCDPFPIECDSPEMYQRPNPDNLPNPCNPTRIEAVAGVV